MPDVAKNLKLYFIVAVALVAASAAALRLATDPAFSDEVLMKVPIDTILQDGWSVETAIDYQEVKGPVFFWCYALGGSIVGGDLHQLRLVSNFFFLASVVPLLMILRRCGANGPMLVAGAMLYALLPYNAVLGQMLMSEPSFIFFALWLMLIFLWSFGRTYDEQKHVWGPVLFAFVLSILLHHRPHAAAFAGAAVLVALERDGLKSWRWWLAAAVAGLSRLPLWYRWGGLVTSDYQDVFSLGFRVHCQAYLLAAMLPVTAVFLWPALREAPNRSRRWWIAAGALLGFVLGTFFQPDLSAKVGTVNSQAEYAGAVRTFVSFLPASALQFAAMALLATLGGAALGALLVVTWSRSITSCDGATRRLFFWTLTGGMGLFSLTTSPVYDRYLVIWLLLVPVVWLMVLPRWLLILQAAVLAMMLTYLISVGR